MRTITREEIEDAWSKFCDMDQQESDQFAKRFLKEQPALGIFLSVQDEQIQDQPDGSRLIELALTAWQTMTEAAGRELRLITPEQIEASEEVNMTSLGNLEDASEMEFMDFTRNTMENYNQRELIGFTVEVLMSRYEDNPDLAPESIGLELLAVKTVIDCLDQHG